MSLYKSKNPALSEKVFNQVKVIDSSTELMTIKGTVNKIAFLGLIVLASSLTTWNLYQTNPDNQVINPYVIGATIAAFVVATIIIFKNTTAPYLSPIYCFLEGLTLGGLSALMEANFPGVVLQSIILTFSILFSLLIIYRLGIIKASENFKLIISSATAGIVIYYWISLIGRLFEFELPYIHDNSIGGIFFSLFVVLIAALNLVIDFDFIERGAESKSPKYMEWYAAFGLMVTIIWLYIEILRLLAKSRSKK